MVSRKVCVHGVGEGLGFRGFDDQSGAVAVDLHVEHHEPVFGVSVVG